MFPVNAIASVILSAGLSTTGAAAVDQAVENAKAHGYTLCQPTTVDASEGWKAITGTDMPDTVGGWAAWPEAFNTCQIGLTPWSMSSLETLNGTAQHEVCHLATGHGIDTDPATNTLEDRHHEAPAFKLCMSRTAEKVHVLPNTTATETEAEEDESATDNGEGRLPQCPDPGNGYCSGINPNKVVFDTRTGATTEVRNLSEEVTPYLQRLCLQLQEAKPWIPCP